MAETEERAQPQYRLVQLFVLSCIALATAAMLNGLRAYVLEDVSLEFGLLAKTIGWAWGAYWLAFAMFVIFGSPMCDYVGMGRLMGIAGVFHIIGTAVCVSVSYLRGFTTPEVVFWAGMFCLGLAHGLVEAVINPLIATLYREQKTRMLNILHAWWPGGLVIGTLLGFALGKFDVQWRIQLSIIFLPSVIYFILVLLTKFPPTERVEHGVPAKEMLREAFRPLYLAIWMCMFLTAATELGPGAWTEAMLTKTVGFSGILALAYISMLMFVFRHFAGPLAQKFSPIGLMWLSSLLAGIGLFGLSLAKSPLPAIVATTFWGVGVCYMWPTMLGITSERFPKGGALLIGMTGFAGTLSTFFVLPAMGKIYDIYTQKFLPAGEQLQNLLKQIEAGGAAKEAAQAILEPARTQAVPYAYQYVSAVAIFLLVVFGIIWLWDRARGGYQAVDISKRAEEEPVELGPEASFFDRMLCDGVHPGNGAHVLLYVLCIAGAPLATIIGSLLQAILAGLGIEAAVLKPAMTVGIIVSPLALIIGLLGLATCKTAQGKMWARSMAVGGVLWVIAWSVLMPLAVWATGP